MKFIILFVSFLMSHSVEAKQILLEDGKTYQIQDGDEILCKHRKRLKCQVDFEYVGKKYVLKAPNGKIHGYFKKEEDAHGKAQSLVGMNVCEQVILNYDNEDLN